jgi:hypothetical protein
MSSRILVNSNARNFIFRRPQRPFSPPAPPPRLASWVSLPLHRPRLGPLPPSLKSRNKETRKHGNKETQKKGNPYTQKPVNKEPHAPGATRSRYRAHQVARARALRAHARRAARLAFQTPALPVPKLPQPKTSLTKPPNTHQLHSQKPLPPNPENPPTPPSPPARPSRTREAPTIQNSRAEAYRTREVTTLHHPTEFER